MDGLLLIDKPSQCTSHDVVARMRRLLKLKRVGHAGTLDPNATGLLVLALGKATRWLQHLPSDKRYAATLRFGLETDTQDIWGNPLAEQKNLVDPGQEKIIQALSNLCGQRMQVPPMVSALKQNGVRLYQLARRGVEVARQARPIEIYSLKVTRIAFPEVDFELHCSSGTYVRSLCAEIGQQLGLGACMAALRRTALGPFSLAQATSLSDVNVGTLRLVDADLALGHLPARVLSEPEAQFARQGRSLPWAGATAGSEIYRLLTSDGHLLGLGQVRQKDSAWTLHPQKVFL